jgi:hypothetical protein
MAETAGRLRLEKELESLADGMPTEALDILVQYATKLRDAYAAKQEENGKRQR